MSFNIAIDGPAGAGKSTIAKSVASKLGFIYVDTGAMYRTLALYFIRLNILPDEIEKIQDALKDVEVSISYENGSQQVILNGENVSGFIRTEEVGAMASKVSAYPVVREKLLELQRTLAKKNDVLMDGRDIGTNILPNADIKIYLTASSKERARRRALEYQLKGIPCDVDEIEKQINERDEQDKNREVAPLKQAEDAIYLDTSDMSIDQVIDTIMNIYEERRA